jgi:hypothetical protein
VKSSAYKTLGLAAPCAAAGVDTGAVVLIVGSLAETTVVAEVIVPLVCVGAGSPLSPCAWAAIEPKIKIANTKPQMPASISAAWKTQRWLAA